MRKRFFILASFLFVLNLLICFVVQADEPVKPLQILSDVYQIDRKFKSMEGPVSSKYLTLLPADQPPELLWITSFRTQIVGEDGVTPMPSEFMCHINLEYDPASHSNGQLPGWQKQGVYNRMFTLSQGAFMAEFPEGFGIPVMSNESLKLTTQVLNHNLEKIDAKVRHKVTIEFIRDRDLKKPLRPLFCVVPFGMKVLKGKGYWKIVNPDESRHGSSCLPGKQAPADVKAGGTYTDPLGQKFTGHWIIDKGVEVNRFNVTSLMSIPFDTTFHYAVVHMHPFAKSIELKDLTDGRTIFKAYVKGFPAGRIGIERVDSFSSVEGVPVYKDHQYQIISVYENTSKNTQDAMASIFMYLEDEKFQKPTPEQSVQISTQPPVQLPQALETQQSTQVAADKSPRSFQYLSPVYHIDRIYKSMEGPRFTEPIALLPNQPTELVWITGIRTEIVSEDGKTPLSPEFMCHVNLDYDSKNDGRLDRIFLLSQGAVFVDLPEGFGIPALSNEPLLLNTQVLNHNYEHPNLQVRHRVTIEFTRDKDLKQSLTPLFSMGAQGMKLVEGKDGYWEVESPDESKHGASCLLGNQAPNADPGFYTDGYGRKFTGHWVVKPGREVNHSNVTHFMDVPFDTKLHYAVAHLHPFAESLELRDVTLKKTLIKSNVENRKDAVGIKFVEFFSSKKGIPIYKDHEYEVISTYNNTSTVDRDSMVSIVMYVEDKEFKKPAILSEIEPNQIPIEAIQPDQARQPVQVATKEIISTKKLTYVRRHR